jgi:hypothetical protein
LKVHLPENPEIPVLEVPVQKQENPKQEEEEEEAKTGQPQEMNPPPPPALTLLNFESLNF